MKHGRLPLRNDYGHAFGCHYRSCQSRDRSTALSHFPYNRSRSSAGICGTNSRSSAQLRAISSCAVPIADGQAGQIGGTQRRRLEGHRPANAGPQHVGLKLHQGVVDRRAAVDPQIGQRQARIALHRQHQIARLIGDRIERRAGDVGRGRAAGQIPKSRPGRKDPNTARPGPRSPAPGKRPPSRQRCAASGSTSLDCLMIPKPSRSHCTTAPAMKTEPSRQ